MGRIAAYHSTSDKNFLTRNTRPQKLAAIALLVVKLRVSFLRMKKDLSYSNPVKNTVNTAMRLLRDICSPITTGIDKIKMNKSKMILRGP